MIHMNVRGDIRICRELMDCDPLARYLKTVGDDARGILCILWTSNDHSSESV